MFLDRELILTKCYFNTDSTLIHIVRVLHCFDTIVGASK